MKSARKTLMKTIVNSHSCKQDKDVKSHSIEICIVTNSPDVVKGIILKGLTCVNSMRKSFIQLNVIQPHEMDENLFGVSFDSKVSCLRISQVLSKDKRDI